MPDRWPCGRHQSLPERRDDALYFSHGFRHCLPGSDRHRPSGDVDVILAAPKGSGTTVRTNFLDGSGINSSFAVHQDYTGRAKERTLAWASPSAPATCSPPPLKKRSTVTSPANAACSWDVWPVSWKPSTTCCAKWPQPQRGLQRDGGRTDPEPDSVGGPKRHGLDVRQLQHHRPARCPGLGPPLPGCRGPVFDSFTKAWSPAKRPGGPWIATALRIIGNAGCGAGRHP
jgi:hypothetical protein